MQLPTYFYLLSTDTKLVNTFPVLSLLSCSLAKQPIELKSFTNQLKQVMWYILNGQLVKHFSFDIYLWRQVLIVVIVLGKLLTQIQDLFFARIKDIDIYDKTLIAADWNSNKVLFYTVDGECL